MNGALVVLLAAAGTYLIIRGIRDFHNSNRQHRVNTSFLANHQRDIADAATNVNQRIRTNRVATMNRWLNGPLPKRARTGANRSEPYHNRKQRFPL